MKQIIKTFIELIKFPHVCMCKGKQSENIDFEMNGPLSDKEQTQFIIKCKDCGYGHSMMIKTEDALKIREFCIEKELHTSERFQKMDCYVCERGTPMSTCFFYPRGVIGECRGYNIENDEWEKYIAKKVFL